jgi:hypothetical protein
MRTLMTQMRLRRVLRVHDELLERLQAEVGGPDAQAAAQAGSRRLLELLRGVRSAWEVDVAEASGADLALLDAHVRRSLRSLEAAAAALGRPRQRDWLGRQFRETALPLLLCLRGLEDVSEPALGGAVGPVLARSA